MPPYRQSRLDEKAQGAGPREDAAIVKSLGDTYKNKGYLRGLEEVHMELI